jgi:6-phosphogluconolactonase (cycloisomerase 2 family)
MRVERRKGRKVVLATGLVIAFGIFLLSGVDQPANTSDPNDGSARLVSVEQLPDYAELCAPEGVSAIAALRSEFDENSLLGAFKERSVYAADTVEVTRPPVRTIRDTYPIYSSVAVDSQRDEVILQDTNLFAIRIFNRLENTPPGVAAATPIRIIEGKDTKNEYNNGLYVDPQSGDLSNVAMDTADAIFTYRAGASGNAEPMRILNIPHRGFQVAADEERQELYSTNQYPPRLLVFRKGASGDEKPLRVIEGPNTGLADVHAVAVDARRNLVFVGNWGNSSNYKVAGTGKHYPASITVFTRDANGDATPIRTIQGSKTQLNWMGGFSLDPETGNLWVANDVGNSVLVFRGTDSGDVAPMKVIKGDKTGLDHPAGVSVDTKNKEVWISNMGNSSATAYSLTANGNAAPIRTIRTAPVGWKSLKFGKPQAIAYDSKRDELLVPN